MPSGEYERYRQQLDTQLRADVELIYEAYRAKLRAYETVAHARGEALEILPPADFPSGLPAPMPPLSPRPAPPPTPAPGPIPAPPPARRSPSFQVDDAVSAALVSLPEVFDKFDLSQALGFTPRRSTLYRIFQRLLMGGVLRIETPGVGKYPTAYRKTGVSS